MPIQWLLDETALHSYHRDRASNSAAHCPREKRPRVAGQPSLRGIRSDREVHRAPAVMGKDDEDKEQSEASGWNHKEIGRNERRCFRTPRCPV
jgi:hypothetical protein